MGWFKEKPRKRSLRALLHAGVKICAHCKGDGVYSNGYVRLSCHRCLNGITTVAREQTAIEWERHCAMTPFSPKSQLNDPDRAARREAGDAIMVRYREARKDDAQLWIDIDEAAPRGGGLLFALVGLSRVRG